MTTMPSNGGGPLKAGKNTLIDTAEKAAKLKARRREQLFIHSRCAGKHGRDPEALVMSLDRQEYLYTWT